MDYAKILDKARMRVRFSSPADLLTVAHRYFQWAQDTPLKEENVYVHRGIVTRADTHKTRAFSRKGFAAFAGVPLSYLNRLRGQGPEWAEALDLVEQVIEMQLYEHAAAGMLNANLVARTLGLAERSEVTGRDGGPLQTQDVTDEEKLLDEARRLGIDPRALGLGGGATQGEGTLA